MLGPSPRGPSFTVGSVTFLKSTDCAAYFSTLWLFLLSCVFVPLLMQPIKVSPPIPPFFRGCCHPSFTSEDPPPSFHPSGLPRTPELVRSNSVFLNQSPLLLSLPPPPPPPLLFFAAAQLSFPTVFAKSLPSAKMSLFLKRSMVAAPD